jgi:hypothetical protein
MNDGKRVIRGVWSKNIVYTSFFILFIFVFLLSVSVGSVDISLSNTVREIFSSGITYDRATEEYIDVLGQLHIKIAAVAQKAIECVYGNNTFYKGET